MNGHSLQGHPGLNFAVQRLERLKPDQFEIYFERRGATKIDSKDQAVDSLTLSEDVGMAIRLVRDRKLGFSFTTSMLNDAIERAIESAWEIAATMPADEHNGFFSFTNFVYPEVDAWDAKGLTVPTAEKIEMAKHLEAACRKADARIKGVRQASLSERSSEIHLIDSNGEHIHHRGTLFSASISAKAEDKGDSQMGGEFDFSSSLENLNLDHVATQAARWATELLGAGMPPTMKCPAVLRNSVVAELIDFLSSSFSAEEVEKGRSMLAGRSGERLFSEKVTLIDDSLYPGGMGTSPFDGEGVPSGKTVLVDGGFVSGFLYDGYYARKLDKKPTGSAGRSVKAPPSIQLSNLYLTKGRKKPESLLEGIKQGILITDLMGLHTANPVTGDFSLGASGILIEKGKLTRPVKGFAVAGNVLGLLSRITDVANDLRFFGTVGAPSVRISELSVGGA